MENLAVQMRVLANKANESVNIDDILQCVKECATHGFMYAVIDEYLDSHRVKKLEDEGFIVEPVSEQIQGSYTKISW